MMELEQKKLNEELLNASRFGNLELVKELLGRGAELEAKTKDGWTALHFASAHLEAVKELLDRGADIAAKDYKGWTALHMASYYKRLEVVKELIERGADIEAKDNDGFTALHRACSNGEPKTVKELVGMGAEIDLLILSKYPEIVINYVREQMGGMEDKWDSVLLFVMREREKTSEEEFKKRLLKFLDNKRIEIPENIYIVLKIFV